jgi:Tfp pilus assembly pilus retraction ATPase PilT
MVQVNTAGIDDLLQQLWEVRATDLLLTEGAPPLCRVDGQMAPLAGRTPLRGADTDRLILGCLDEAAAAELKAERELDFAFAWGDDVRFRANAFYQRGSLALSLRVLPMRIPTMAELGMPEQVEQFLTRGQGLVLVTSTAPVTSSPSRTRWSSCTGTSGRPSTNGRSAATRGPSSGHCVLSCGRTPTCFSSARCGIRRASRPR